ncbi:SIR2 family protein, partial [Escherichia coli]|nr:SIR2 family protein [Escherichia coli]
GKKKIGVLMGAGAPVSINIGASNDDWISLIPNLQGLTKTVKEKLSAKELKVYQDLEKSILSPNLEKVLSKIRALNEVIGDSIVYG